MTCMWMHNSMSMYTYPKSWMEMKQLGNVFNKRSIELSCITEEKLESKDEKVIASAPSPPRRAQNILMDNLILRYYPLLRQENNQSEKILFTRDGVVVERSLIVLIGASAVIPALHIFL
mmetsp:Transcript_20470/g.30631  ORF Transcript_20470/g.30631 Transcript_20470/m.30631 type:complete len:119 (+) Transcript_20470:264-620(+)